MPNVYTLSFILHNESKLPYTGKRFYNSIKPKKVGLR